MATLVERTSRYTVPVALPAGRRDATTTCHALIGAVTDMPVEPTKTLTWDQGSEMAAHAAFPGPAARPPGRRDATPPCHALIGAVTDMPVEPTKTLTWDQGSEMAAHAAFRLATTVDVFFAHPHAPWERGTNENTNRLLREYFPKGTEITDDQAYLDLVARELNNRPRRILGVTGHVVCRLRAGLDRRDAMITGCRPGRGVRRTTSWPPWSRSRPG